VGRGGSARWDKKKNCKNRGKQQSATHECKEKQGGGEASTTDVKGGGLVDKKGALSDQIKKGGGTSGEKTNNDVSTQEY